MPRPYSNSLSSPVFTHYDRTQSSFRFQYWLLTIITFSEIAVVVAITVIALNCYFSCYKRNSFRFILSLLSLTHYHLPSTLDSLGSSTNSNDSFHSGFTWLFFPRVFFFPFGAFGMRSSTYGSGVSTTVKESHRSVVKDVDTTKVWM